MSNLSFLLVAIGVSVIGSVLLWLRNRKPQAFMSSIETFEREMGALAGEPDPPSHRRSRPTPLVPIVPKASDSAGLADKLRAARAGDIAAPADVAPRQPIVPSAGQQGLADKLRAAQRLRREGGTHVDRSGPGGDPAGGD